MIFFTENVTSVRQMRWISIIEFSNLYANEMDQHYFLTGPAFRVKLLKDIGLRVSFAVP